MIPSDPPAILRAFMGEPLALRGVRDLPHNLEAEQAVLGAVLLDETAFDQVAALLKSEDFYSLAHQHVFAAFEDLAKESRKIDPVLVQQRLDLAQGLGIQQLPASVGGIQPFGLAPVEAGHGGRPVAVDVQQPRRHAQAIGQVEKLPAVANGRERGVDDHRSPGLQQGLCPLPQLRIGQRGHVRRVQPRAECLGAGPVDRESGQFLADDVGSEHLGAEGSGQCPRQRGLADPVAAEHDGDLTQLGLKAHVAEDVGAAVILVDVFDIQHVWLVSFCLRALQGCMSGYAPDRAPTFSCVPKRK